MTCLSFSSCSLHPSYHWSTYHRKVSCSIYMYIFCNPSHWKIHTAPYFTLVGTKLEELTHHSSQGDDGVEQGEGFDDEDSQCSKEPDVVDVGAEVSELYERVVKLSGDIRNTMEQSLNMRASHAKSTVPQHNIASNGRTEENNSDASELPTDDDPSPRSPQAPPTNSTTPTTTTAPADQSHSSLFGEKSDTPPPQFADPKVRKAYERMLRLDERLAALGRREREVKRQRKLLEQEMNKPDSGEGSVLAGENGTMFPLSQLVSVSIRQNSLAAELMAVSVLL